ncbi:hypothetical protein [Pengzhenrongella sicca]|uniref:Uncharacterized protein n=1 Tax=Pengzhenrongella sicca TaxID=2819238 RepID=A0A8A4ZC09_9MICO|nr:hypothetical protein [Pengzhenrongella sicca]QTE29452.1 hypothetical protein J4E96_19710 [Pengzhenrongella sicca]
MLLEKVVTPWITRGYLLDGNDRVAGYVSRAVDVEGAVTPDQLIAAHRLTGARFPFHAGAPWLDVLRFESSPQLHYIPGRPGAPEPPWWLRHSRLTPGAELLRRFDDGSFVVLGRYLDLGAGWQVVHAAVPRPSAPALSRCVGPVAQWHGSFVDADVVDGGRSVVLALASPPLEEPGFAPGARGRWRRVVPRADVTELFELDVTAAWRGLPVRMVDQWMGRDRDVIARISSLSDDDAAASSRGMPCVDPGLYELTVPAAELTDLVALRLPIEPEPAPPPTMTRRTSRDDRRSSDRAVPSGR